jgi:hypothetical protein
MPFTISAPGSYVVRENLTGIAGSNGILITTSGHVTLDLNGFQLVGVPGSLNGVSGSPVGSIVTIKNGTIRNWGSNGIALAEGPYLVMDVHARSNGLDGIQVDVASIVTKCTAYANGRDGISVGRGSLVSECVARFNTGDGIKNLTGRVTIRDCVANSNTGDGIEVDDLSYVVDNTAAENGAGIHAVGTDNRIEANNTLGGAQGIDIDSAGNLIIKNSASGSVTNYSIVAGNTVGPILGVADPIASTNPWANFSF